MTHHRGTNTVGQIDRGYGIAQVTYTVHTKGDWLYQVANGSAPPAVWATW